MPTAAAGPRRRAIAVAPPEVNTTIDSAGNGQLGDARPEVGEVGAEHLLARRSQLAGINTEKLVGQAPADQSADDKHQPE
jgi:hypothetical protein